MGRTSSRRVSMFIRSNMNWTQYLSCIPASRLNNTLSSVQSDAAATVTVFRLAPGICSNDGC